MKKTILCATILVLNAVGLVAESPRPAPFRALVLTERGGQHEAFVAAGLKWLEQAAKDNGFTYDVRNQTTAINEAFLARYQVIIQLNYPPYTWGPESMAAFEKYITEGRGGWVGFHHATLLGEFDGYSMWNWFSDFMGGIRFKNYIASLVTGTVVVEDTQHPCLKGLPASFPVAREEWYTYNQSPRPNVHVLARVDEASYDPPSQITMGDHPVVWTNQKVKARNVYIFMGHDPGLFHNEAYQTLVRNSILWAAGTPPARPPKFRVLGFYSLEVEKDHVEFALDAIKFFNELARQEHFAFDTTRLMSDLNEEKLKNYTLVVWLNDFAHSPVQRAAFEKYMEGGGAWLGFHVAAYNDKTTNWPWFLDFLGGGVFWRNNWPPGPAKLVVDDPTHPVTKGVPTSFTSPANEWYQWKPSPRLKENIKVLVTLSPENYPLGVKDILPDGDLPVVWTNTKYKMLYLNMGHGNQIFSDPAQNRLITNSVLYFRTPSAQPAEK